MFLSYSFTQPYYLYVQYLKYNVFPANVTLTFDSTPSSDPADYIMYSKGGITMVPQQFGFTTLDGSLSISGNNVTLVMPITMDSDIYLTFSYQGNMLPFYIRCNQDYTYTTPAILKGYAA